MKMKLIQMKKHNKITKITLKTKQNLIQYIFKN